MRYFVGDVGKKGGKLHLFPEHEPSGRAKLETPCSVGDSVGYLRRVDVDETSAPKEAEAWSEELGADLCRNCVRCAE